MVYTFSVVDVNEYIASGILESTALGLSSEQDAQAVSCLKKIYPEIQEEYASIERTLEQLALDAAIQPAAEMKERILERIAKESQTVVTSEKEAKIVTMVPNSENESTSNPWKWMAAASVILLFGVGSLWVTSRTESSELTSKLIQFQKKQRKTDQVMLAMKLESERSSAIQAMLIAPNMQNVAMAGTPMEPSASVKVMWSAESKKAIMMATSIAPPPTDMQYQLWAIADGKPVSLGVFNHDELMQITDPFDVALNNISAFAITLEKKGGSEVPHLDKMVVIGNVAV